MHNAMGSPNRRRQQNLNDTYLGGRPLAFPDNIRLLRGRSAPAPEPEQAPITANGRRRLASLLAQRTMKQMKLCRCTPERSP
jgi:hypothetical protein